MKRASGYVAIVVLAAMACTLETLEKMARALEIPLY